MKSLIFFSLLAIIFFNACKPEDSNSKKTGTNTIVGDTISHDEAKRLVTNFDSHVYNPPRPTGCLGCDFKDTRCIWFHKDSLIKILNEITDQKGDGIRFYFAAYDTTGEHGCDHEHLDHSTLVLVSTYDTLINPGKKDSVHKHFDYYGSKRPGVSLTTTPENRGEICPPPSNCYDEGATLLP